MTLEIFATIIVLFSVAFSVQISCGCLLHAFVVGFNLDAVSVLYDGGILCCGGNTFSYDIP